MRRVRVLVNVVLALMLSMTSIGSVESVANAQATSILNPTFLIAANSYEKVYIVFEFNQSPTSCPAYHIQWNLEYHIPPDNPRGFFSPPFDSVGLNCSGAVTSRSTDGLGPCLGSVGGLPLPAATPGLTGGEQARAYLLFLVKEAEQCLRVNFATTVPAYNIYPNLTGAAGPCLTAPTGPSCLPPPGADPRVLADRDRACATAGSLQEGQALVATFAATVAAARMQRRASVRWIITNAFMVVAWAAMEFRCVMPVRVLYSPKRLQAAGPQFPLFPLGSQAGPIPMNGAFVEAAALDDDVIPHVDIPHRIASELEGVPPHDRRVFLSGLEADAYALAANRAANRYFAALQNGDADSAERLLEAYLRFKTRASERFAAFRQGLSGIATAFQGTPGDTMPTPDEIGAVLQTFFIRDVNAFDPTEVLILRAFRVDPTWAIPNVIVIDPTLFMETPSAALKNVADAMDLIIP